MANASGLTIREFQRREIDLPAQFDVAAEHQHQVRFSPSSGAASSHSVLVRTTDISPGGAGLASAIFLPRACEGTLRIFAPQPIEVRRDGTPVHEVAFEHAVKVRRTYMTGHEPTYFVGVSFLDPEPDLYDRITSILEGLVAPEQGDGVDA